MSSKFFDVSRYYERLARKYPNDPRSCGYSNPVAQLARFDSYFRHFDFRDASVLDVGCGTADFLYYLVMAKGVYPCAYYGIDLLSEQIKSAEHLLIKRGVAEVCEQRKIHVMLRQGVLSKDGGNSFAGTEHDIAIACSIFDVKQQDVANTFRIACDTMDVMWSLLDKKGQGIGVDFFSPYALDIQPANAPIPPEWPFSWARQRLSERVLLDATYAPHSYAVIAYKQPSTFQREWNKAGGWPRETGGEVE